MQNTSVDNAVAALLKKTRRKLSPAEVEELQKLFYAAGMHAVLAEIGNQQDTAKAVNFARVLSKKARQRLAHTPSSSKNPYQSPDWKRLNRILAEHQADLVKRPGVVGVGLGYRHRGGIRQDERTVTIYVEKKIASTALNDRLALPTTLRTRSGGTVGVDVVEFGAFERTAFGGSSLGQAGAGGWGTLGVFAVDIATEAPVALTAKHVVGANAPRGQSMYAPWPRQPDSVLIGKYLRGTMDEIDAAAIAVADPNIVSDIIPGIGRVNGARSVLDSDLMNPVVWMYGAYSKYCLGEIQTIHSPLPEHNLVDTIIVRINADSGDSGSVLLDSTNMVLGILVGKGKSTGLHVFSPIDRVLDKLDCYIPAHTH
jgi:hypothetical protein